MTTRSENDTPATPSGPKPSRFRDRPSFRDRRIQRLTTRLPKCLRTSVHMLRRPSVRWIRLPSGILLMIGGTVLSPLPAFGLWMLPVGLVLVAEDIPLARHWVVRMLDAIERHRPDWFRKGGK